MANIDPAHKWTDVRLAKLERRIGREFRQAVNGMRDKIAKFAEQFEKDDKRLKALVEAGKYAEDKYLAWRKTQLTTVETWTALREKLADDLVRTDKLARQLTRDTVADVYAYNHDFATYQIERAGRINTSYTLYNREAVERLMAQEPKKLMHAPGQAVSEAIRERRLKRWNIQKIQSVAIQSILQGDSVPRIAERLVRDVGAMDEKAAIRNARTLITTAENAGRQDAAERAEDMGIKVKRIWVATLDNRTRHEHRMLDGQMRDVDEPFEVDGDEIMYPGDPDAEPYLVYNCRCRLDTVVEGSNVYEQGIGALPRWSDTDLSYDEWRDAHAER